MVACFQKGPVRTRPTATAWLATPPTWCSINRPCRRRNGGMRLKRCAPLTRRQSTPRTSIRSSITSCASEGRVNPLIQIQLLNIRLVTHRCTVRTSSRRAQAHAGQVIPIILVQLLTHTVERRHLGIFQSSIKDGSKGLHGTRRNRMPLLDPTLDGGPAVRIVFDDHPGQRSCPFSMPLAVFVQRIKHLTKQIVSLTQC